MLRPARVFLLLPSLGACLSGSASLGASATLDAGGGSLGAGAEVEVSGPAALALAGGALFAAAARGAGDAELRGSASVSPAPAPGEGAVTAAAPVAAAPAAATSSVAVAEPPPRPEGDGLGSPPPTVERAGGVLAAPPGDASGSAAFELGTLSFAAAAAPPGAVSVEASDEGAGRGASVRVRAAAGEGAPSLGALLGAGVRVDGALTRLADLRLAPAARPGAPAAAGVARGSGLTAEAWVEAQGASQALVVRLRSPASTPPAPRAPLRLTLIVDRSESMERRWADVVVLAEAMLARLSPSDEVQVIGIATGGAVLRPLGPLGDGSSVRAALRAGDVGGGTNLEAGLELAWAVAAPGVRSRVVVLSDGVPNEGAFLPEELAPRAAEALAAGCTTTVVGLGSQFDAPLLRALAEAGGGGYHVGAGARLAPALSAELEAALAAPADGAYVELELPPGLEVHADPGAFRVEGRVARVSVPALAPGAERRLVLPLTGRPAAQLRVHVGWKGPAGPQAVTLAAPAVAAETSLPGDAALGLALDAAAAHVSAGRGRQARAALDAVAEAALASPAPQVRVRAETTLRLGVALETLVPGASHGARRELGLALGTLAWDLRR